MTREEKLYSMTGANLIMIADKLGVKAAANKTRTALKESKSKVIARILEAEAEAEAQIEETEEIREEFTSEEVDEIEARVAYGESFDAAMQTVIMRSEEEAAETPSEAPISATEEVSEEPKQNAKPRTKKTNLKLSELTYNGETKSIRAWAAELEMPWPTLYDRVNRNGWTVEEAIETPLGQRRPK